MPPNPNHHKEDKKSVKVVAQKQEIEHPRTISDLWVYIDRPSLRMTDSLSSSSTSWNCLGTRVLVVKSSSNAAAEEALLIVYVDQVSPSRIRLVLFNGREVYSHVVKVAKVNVGSDDKDKLAQYFLQDNSKHPDVAMQFRHHSDSVSSIKLMIQQKIQPMGLMKSVYAGELKRDDDNNNMSMLKFCHFYLGSAVNSCQSEIKELQNSLTKSEQAVKDWKDTAEKLDKNMWQKEKDRLVDSFLKLWNDFKRKAQTEIQHWKDEANKANAKAAASAKRGRALDMMDVPDDLDEPSHEPISLDVVDAVAEGRRVEVPDSKRKPILDPSEAVSLSKLKEQGEAYKQKRKERTTETKRKRAAPSKSSNAPRARSSKKTKREEKADSSGTDVSATEGGGENSEDEAMRLLIRASVRKADTREDDHESDASF